MLIGQLSEFVRESNKIEGIRRPPKQIEIDATADFLARDHISIQDLERLVHSLQPGAVLRNKPGLDVQVGGYYPPRGGPEITGLLTQVLALHNTPFMIHVAYETLHPFTDGNGRSGRALWAWHMEKRRLNTSLGFLHTFYYQTLQAMQND